MQSTGWLITLNIALVKRALVVLDRQYQELDLSVFVAFMRLRLLLHLASRNSVRICEIVC